MHPSPKVRRRHDADLKSKVIMACKEPGASVAAVALTHGLNANLVRKWLHGRGLKRVGLSPQMKSGSAAPAGAEPIAGAKFIPVVLADACQSKPCAPVGMPPAEPAATPSIEVELRRGTSSLTVRWPASSGSDCAAWLRELAAGWLK
jgi:transposase-like protein